MNEHNITAEQRQAREKAIYRYINALDRGDIDTIISILHQAENDSLLEQMIFDTHAAYQLEEPMQQNTSFEQEQPAQTTAYSAEHIGLINRRPQPPRKHRAMLLQVLVAAVIAALLIGGSLYLFQSHSPSTLVTQHKTATPVAPHQADNTIITITNTAQITARHVTNGAIIWQKTLPTRSPIDLDNGQPGIVIQNHVLYIAYQGYMRALQLNDGKQLWEKQLGASTVSLVVGDNQPQIMADQERIYVSGYLGSTLYALEQKTGALSWSYPSSAYSSLLAIGPDMIYVMKNGDNDNNGVYALNSASGQKTWSYASSMPLSATIADNVLYVQTSHSLINDPIGANKDQKPLLALNAITGQLEWSVIAPATGPSPLTATDDVVVLYNGSNTCAYKTSNGTPAWCPPIDMANSLGSPSTRLLAANGNIYIMAPAVTKDNHLVTQIEAIAAQSGTTLWTKQLSALTATVNPSNNVIVTYTTSHQLQGFSLANGAPLWTLKTTEKAPITNIVVGN